jgi:hypothetical protein
MQVDGMRVVGRLINDQTSVVFSTGFSVITVGRVLVGGTQTVEIPMTIAADAKAQILAYAEVFSSTAQPVITDGTLTNVQ